MNSDRIDKQVGKQLQEPVKYHNGLMNEIEGLLSYVSVG